MAPIQEVKKTTVVESKSKKALKLVLLTSGDAKSVKKLAPSEFLSGADLVLTVQPWPKTPASEKAVGQFDGIAVQSKDCTTLMEKAALLARLAARSPLIAIVEKYEDRPALQLLSLGVQEVLPRQDASPGRLRRKLVHSMVRFRRLNKAMSVAASQSALQSLNRIPLGIMVVDPECRILHANNQAQNMLANGHGLMRSDDGRCTTRDQKTNLQLQEMVLRLTSNEVGDEEDQETLLVPAGNGGQGLSLLLVPAGLKTGKRNAVIFLTSPETEIAVSHPTLKRLYGLTDAEAALAEKLVQGHTLEEIASKAGRSSHTLRSQLKQIFQKTETNRQSQLIKKVLTGPAVLGGPRPNADIPKKQATG